MKIINVIQGTDEWKNCRLGIPTSSNFEKLITTKGETSKQRYKYLYRLAGEKVSGNAEETYQNGAMQRGIELEDEARQMYQIVNGEEVEQVGFCLEDGEKYGCSPDGLVGKDGGIEIKCPSMAVHVGYLIDNKLPSEYFQQTQGQLLVTGRKWWDFISYYPGIKPLIVRVKQDKEFHKALNAELKAFCDLLEETINKIRS